MSNKIRCAIYTRKSSDDGLEQEFNSLDAQREACEAFVRSQRGLGWVALSSRYDDGGLSGGTMERPALKRLLRDVEAGLIDVVVVYKIDRLSRSLTDFAKLVEVFERHNVTFVSVTQQFNTTTSMGRLTLNVLLSFAQFEREVTAERIRDKIAASKRKGMWMGGQPPLGYDVADKKLVANAAEARTVRKLFDLYLELGSVRRLKQEADRLGLVTKRRTSGGRATGGKPFSRGNLYQLLHNPIYVGEIAHKGRTYPGQHEAIIGRETWVAVQQKLESQASPRAADTNGAGTCLLTGLVFDNTGERLCPTYATKNGRRYRYYVSKRLVHDTDKGDAGWRIPAKELEQAVGRAIRDFLHDHRRLIEAVRLPADAPVGIRRVLDGASALAARMTPAAPDEYRNCLRRLLHRAMLDKATLRVDLSRPALLELILGTCDDQVDGSDEKDDLVHLEAPIELRRRGVEGKLVLSSSPVGAPDEKLIALLTRSCRWVDQLATGDVRAVGEIAARDHLDVGDVSRFLPLAFLAPDIVDAIVTGRHPTELTAEALRKACPIPYSWQDQRRRLGFSF
jgi:DNA invertase Pin-like site-specific DNA recombinase